MILKYDNFRFYLAIVTEKSFTKCQCEGTFAL